MNEIYFGFIVCMILAFALGYVVGYENNGDEES